MEVSSRNYMLSIQNDPDVGQNAYTPMLFPVRQSA
jgi:hypothetical protein